MVAMGEGLSSPAGGKQPSVPAVSPRSGAEKERGGRRGRRDGSERVPSRSPRPPSKEQGKSHCPLQALGAASGCLTFQKLNLSLVFFFIETANTRSWKGLIKIIESNGVHAQPKCRLVPFLAPLIYQMLI